MFCFEAMPDCNVRDQIPSRTVCVFIVTSSPWAMSLSC